LPPHAAVTPGGVEADRADLLVARNAVDGQLTRRRCGAYSGRRGVHRGDDGDGGQRRAQRREVFLLQNNESNRHSKALPQSFFETMREGSFHIRGGAGGGKMPRCGGAIIRAA